MSRLCLHLLERIYQWYEGILRGKVEKKSFDISTILSNIIVWN